MTSIKVCQVCHLDVGRYGIMYGGKGYKVRQASGRYPVEQKGSITHLVICTDCAQKGWRFDKNGTPVQSD